MVLQTKNKTVGGIVRPYDYQEPVFLRTPEGTAAGREAVEPVLPSVPPQIGDIVLFSIGPNTFRPLLVVSLREMGKVSGTVFLDPDIDSSAPWVHRNCFAKPQKTSPYQFVEKVPYGDGLGEWREKPAMFVMPHRLSEIVEQGILTTSSGNFVDPRATE